MDPKILPQNIRPHLQSGLRLVIKALPPLMIVVLGCLPLRPVMRSLLVAATLIWLQAVVVFEVFLNGK